MVLRFRRDSDGINYGEAPDTVAVALRLFPLETPFMSYVSPSVDTPW